MTKPLKYLRRYNLSYLCIDNYVVFSWIGHTLNELYRFDKAIKVYQKAIDIINEDYEKKVNFHKEPRWDSPSDSYFNVGQYLIYGVANRVY